MSFTILFEVDTILSRITRMDESHEFNINESEKLNLRRCEVL